MSQSNVSVDISPNLKRFTEDIERNDAATVLLKAEWSFERVEAVLRPKRQVVRRQDVFGVESLTGK